MSAHYIEIITWVDREGEVEIYVSAKYTPAVPAYIDGPWESCYPEEPASVDWLEVVDNQGNTIELTEREEERIFEEIEEEYNNE